MCEVPVLPTPTCHHLHLNSVDPDAAIDFYTRQFASTSRTTWNGEPALDCGEGTLISLQQGRVGTGDRPAAHRALAFRLARAGLTREPRALSAAARGKDPSALHERRRRSRRDQQRHVAGQGRRARAHPASRSAKRAPEASNRRGVAASPTWKAPTTRSSSPSGNQPKERFNHVHMWQEHPFCAQLWYRLHLNAPSMPGRESATPLTEQNCQVREAPTARGLRSRARGCIARRARR